MFEIVRQGDTYAIAAGGSIIARFEDTTSCLLARARFIEWWERHDLEPAARIEAAIKELIYRDKLTGEFGRCIRGFWVGVRSERGEVCVVVSEMQKKPAL